MRPHWRTLACCLRRSGQRADPERAHRSSACVAPDGTGAPARAWAQRTPIGKRPDFDPAAIDEQVADDFFDHPAGTQFGPEGVKQHIQARPRVKRAENYSALYTARKREGQMCRKTYRKMFSFSDRFLRQPALL